MTTAHILICVFVAAATSVTWEYHNTPIRRHRRQARRLSINAAKAPLDMTEGDACSNCGGEGILVTKPRAYYDAPAEGGCMNCHRRYRIWM